MQFKNHKQQKACFYVNLPPQQSPRLQIHQQCALLPGMLSSLKPGIDITTFSHNSAHLGHEARHAINFQEKDFQLKINYWEY